MPGKKLSYIHSLTTVTPPKKLSQNDAALHMAARSSIDSLVVRRLYRLAGVDVRQTAVDDHDQLYADHTTSPSTAQRMQRFEVAATELAISAARAAIFEAQLDPSEISELVTVSCTGFFAPGIDHAIIQALELSTTVARTNVGFMGCHAALNALNLADALARAKNATVLVVCVELCSLHLQYSDIPDLLVANSLFSDGAAAFVCSPDLRTTTRFKIQSLFSDIIPHSQDLMSWRIGDHGFEMTLSSKLPEKIEASLPSIINKWAKRDNWNLNQIAGWAVHPGGPRLLSACEPVTGPLLASREILRSHGNMSSPTVLFILNQVAENNGDYCMLAFGPGVSLEGAILKAI